MLIDRLGLTDVRSIQPDPGDLAASDPTACCTSPIPICAAIFARPMPLEKALQGFDVVVSGRKRYHGGERRSLTALAIDGERVKAEPLAASAPLDIELYMAIHDLPRHPLTEIGYFSIGCEPCTVQGGKRRTLAPDAGPEPPRPNAASTGPSTACQCRRWARSCSRVLKATFTTPMLCWRGTTNMNRLS